MLPNLFEVYEWIFKSSANGSHAPKCGALQLLALIEGLRILE